MSKNLKVNTDYVKNTIMAEITKALDKLNSAYKMLNTASIPTSLDSRTVLMQTKEKMYILIKDLTKFKNQLTTICNKYDLESNLAVDDILAINHFLLNISK